MTCTRARGQVKIKMSLGSKDRMETNGHRDEADCIALICAIAVGIQLCL